MTKSSCGRYPQAPDLTLGKDVEPDRTMALRRLRNGHRYFQSKRVAGNPENGRSLCDPNRYLRRQRSATHASPCVSSPSQRMPCDCSTPCDLKGELFIDLHLWRDRSHKAEQQPGSHAAVGSPGVRDFGILLSTDLIVDLFPTLVPMLSLFAVPEAAKRNWFMLYGP